MGMILGSGGKGGRRGRRSLNAEINVTPFVDVMLVLLIVFMITAPLLTVGVPVDLPKTEAKALSADSEPLTITIQPDGTIFLQETEIPMEELVPRLSAMSEAGYQERIFVRGDNAVEYGKVMRVMARLNSAGFTNIGMVTDPTETTENE